ncbi:putative 3-hydroxyisobutyryl-CoA hydrolase [Arabidopsis thaliana]|uniref:3-hydroxyisobutyryl-CoA hydrolase 1 n=4 Tax=Arabidopsis TaxID=3701 RepID=HIBC1_ARATH|nr:beta-hydroxyisobutyryl-CoA hydrolase 1 [Arabidopsis thaliana]NP_201395.1 beta-hydroxyisobutyryl-CoA hydrolase 1 [Arabidopsis thaliana]Q9LKJ1.1 RecName: Full=3-hydroxyisobutyryl-CoA hydrolase 1; AltName: Full=CoA-thioester hydrolase CHY1 [Arabidopsis thaliana]KAG7607464.1 Enoyl-CoA hydratase/isomerase HIBYL-CoA-H type [Arabidopsis thaliana x Arabidopsis arenosa]AAF77193.1 CoA-thioester hydrolase CHY1 [Arabidopsis thaliana]AAN41356.1 putative 3-hydroxyisobutyryl-coenzyme A hydrolase [Arabidop|eukprot:NP_001330538.1 beta-hydroxyisobutyryl-CoA hydrolase 1 [Arabidopsis thaliana]
MAVEMASQSQVLVEEKSSVRILTLNRPKQLNALSFHMISRLLQLFLAFEEDPSVKLVILKGHGRAFCAGGDVAAVVRDINQGNWRLGANYFSSEYMLNYVMATYSKAQVSILNGIVMGGGAGVSVHGRFRIATENTVFAMPETALGLFPDVGASYFLSRLPGFFGEYVGLTGARLDGAEMLACGLATHFVPSTRLTALEADLCRINSNDPTFASTILDAYTQHPRLKQQSAYRRLDVIDRCFSRRTVEEIISALEREATQEADGWISATIQALKKGSPASLKISLRSIREGRLQGVGQCLIREYRMVCHVMKGEISKDFVEGCRAILVDKDKNPKWEPRRLEDMKDSMVEQYFERVEREDDLKLPPRNNLPALGIAKL